MGLVPWELNSKWLDILSRSGSALFVSCKPGILTPDQEKELAKAFEIASVQRDELVPLDWMETTRPQLYKINGERVEYNWYGVKGTENFVP
jgi:alpha-galactosidase